LFSYRNTKNDAILLYTAAAISAIWRVSAKFREILRKLEIAVQGHLRSSILVPMESAYFPIGH